MYKFVSITSFVLFFGSLSAWSQLPADALRYAYPLYSGTARAQGIGGAIGALGGDITSAHVNPAGIGLFKNKEVVITPGYSFINNKYDYRGTTTSSRDNAFNYGTSGFVFGSGNNGMRPGHSSAFSFTINQLANYNNRTEYRGFNNFSSWSEQYVEQLVRDRATIPQAENNYIFGSSLAFWTYLVDTIADPSGNVIGYQSLVPLPLPGSGGNQGVNQYNLVETRGGAHEAALSYGSNSNDKLHLGFSVGIPIYSFKKEQTYREEDASGLTNNDFNFFEYRESYRTDGIGVNLKLGVIYRPVERLRLGFAFHTPTWASMEDEIRSSITTDTESYTVFQQPATKTSDELKGNSTAGVYEYNISTPYRAMASIAYVINEVKDVKKQKGFISADVEYVNYRSMRFRAADESLVDDVRYYNDLNAIIKERYKGALNLRLGGELKFNTIMGRLGFAYMSSPFAQEELKGSRMVASGGLGYRNKGVFVDLTYAHAFVNYSDVPYWLADKPNTVADGRNNLGNLVLTVGFKIL